MEICAEDSGSPKLSNSCFVNIEVSDINDNPPLFSEENYTAIVQVSSFSFYVDFFIIIINGIAQKMLHLTFHVKYRLIKKKQRERERTFLSLFS